MKKAFGFIVLMGMVSLFADIVYEGARGVTGPFLATLGASAVVVGFVAGLGEFISYALRLLFGRLADRTKAYWTLTFIGYGMILAVPLLSAAYAWQAAAMFIIMERMGKAVRSPARDTILSYATKKVGRGLGFGIHEALDQVGAIIGPLIFTFVFLTHGTYRKAFSFMWIPVLAVFAVLYVAKRKVPAPEILEESETEEKPADGGKFSPTFFFYAVFTFICVAGFVNFQIISFNLKTRALMPDALIPALFALAMGVDAVAALVIGRIYDKVGMKALLAAPILSIFVAASSFSSSVPVLVSGIVVWGMVMGVHETIMRAAVADLTPMSRRGTAYGIFNTLYGAAFLFGGLVMGILYEVSVGYLVGFACLMQLVSITIFSNQVKNGRF